mmetsp:Transcript_104816/g.224017  ORF Transcript_104816/g.224017 Transcript_104816/m.224017 type:complete len:239 (-) Transcript_104816:86-802(-)
MAEAIFEEAITRVFSRWTLLALAVDQGWGGRDSVAKARQLQEEVVNQLHAAAGRKRPPSHDNASDVEALSAYLVQRLDELFNCEADDSSDTEVATICLRLFATCRTGDTSFAQQFLQATANQAPNLSQCQGVEKIEYATEEDELLDGLNGMDLDHGDHISEGNESDDGMEAAVAAALEASESQPPPQIFGPDPSATDAGGYPAAAAAAPARPVKAAPPEPVVDDDGFEMVPKGGRRMR